MSNALAIASVTAVIKNLLENGRVEFDINASIGRGLTVTARPPDQIKIGEEEDAQLNLFLYQVTPNTRLRTPSLASMRVQGNGAAQNGSATAGENGHSENTLLFDLHYLLTAYGSQMFQAEILLGYALHTLQQELDLTTADIQKRLKSAVASADESVTTALTTASLATQVQRIEIRPQFLTLEEMSKIWSALQARYRPSMAYKVSLVLLEQRPILDTPQHHTEL
jgi:hypothetical protein